MNSRPLITGFFSRFSIAYAVVIGAVFTKEAFSKRGVESDLLMGLRGSVLLAGILFGALILGRLADQRGRREALMWSTVIRSLGMLLTPLMPNYALALLMRFLSGFGIGGSMASTTSYILERSYKEVRGRNVVLMESMRARGSTVAGIAGYISAEVGISRISGFIASFVFGIITILLVRISPETVVRLAKLGDAEAKAMAERMGFIITEKKFGVKDLLRTFLKYSILLRIARAIVGFAYYYRLYTIREVLSKLGAAGASAFKKLTISLAAQLAGYAYAYMLIDKIGRRPLLIASFILAAVSLPLYYVNPTVAGSLFIAFNVGVRGTIYTYTPELYPTELRATALGSAVAAARVGAMIGPIVGTLALASGIGLRIAILAVIHAAGAIFILPLPETKGKTIA